jgi:GT2 family glycosyltransferase
VVDNGSTDGSTDNLEGQFNIPIYVIRNENNRGFAAACNQGAAEGVAPYILFLNPDTRVFDGTLKSAVAVFERSDQRDVGIMGVQLLDDESKIARSCARFPQLGHFIAISIGLDKLPWFRWVGYSMKEWSHTKTRVVDEVMGAFFLVRRDLFDRLEGFDERFFVYYEEVDFSLRAHKAGYHSVYYADAQAFHLGGGTSRQVKAIRLFYSLRSRLLYGFKNFSVFKAWVLLVVTVFLEPFTRVGYCFLQRDWLGVKNTILGYCMLLREMRSIIRKRSTRIRVG